MLPYVVGVALSIGVALFARWVGFDRDRAFYPTVLIVIASYYVLFAVMSGSVETVLLESIMMTLFAVAAVAGFKGSAWIIVGALAGHGVQDAFHGDIISMISIFAIGFRTQPTRRGVCTGALLLAKAGLLSGDVPQPLGCARSPCKPRFDNRRRATLARRR
jgi:hypothetical protein